MLLTQAQAMKELNISRGTILRWEQHGLLTPHRTIGGHRRYDRQELLKALGIDTGDLKNSYADEKSCVVYARVSTKKQESSGNLERQIDRISKYAEESGYVVSRVFSEVASGINENRRQLDKMIKYVQANNIKYVVVEYKDRLARFGYKYIETSLNILGAQVVVLEDADEKDINQEMAEDIISIITSFSAKLYGRRGAKNIKDRLKQMYVERSS